MLLSAGYVTQAESWLRRGAVIAEQSDNPQLLAWDAAGTALVAMLRGETTGVAADPERAAEHAARAGDPNIAGSVLAWRAQFGAETGAAAAWVGPVTDQLEH